MGVCGALEIDDLPDHRPQVAGGRLRQCGGREVAQLVGRGTGSPHQRDATLVGLVRGDSCEGPARLSEREESPAAAHERKRRAAQLSTDAANTTSTSPTRLHAVAV